MATLRTIRLARQLPSSTTRSRGVLPPSSTTRSRGVLPSSSTTRARGVLPPSSTTRARGVLPPSSTTRARGVLQMVFQPHVRRMSTAPDYVISSVVPHMDFETGNFAEFLLKDSPKWGSSVAVTCTDSEENITYGTLRDHMGRWGGYLKKQAGIGEGDVVAVVAPNTLHYPTVVFGTIRVGAVFMGVNPSYTPGEIAHQLKDSNAKMVVVYGPLEPTVRKALNNIRKPFTPMLSIGTPSPGGIPRVEDVLSNKDIQFANPVEVSGSEVMTLIYSSGTTGLPKGVEITHDAGITNIAMMGHPRHFAPHSSSIASQKSYTNLLPMFHLSGFLAVSAMAMFKGLRLYNITKFDPNTYLETVRKNKVTHLHLVPSIINFVLSRPEFRRDQFPHLESVMTGAAPVSQSSSVAMQERMGSEFYLQTAYGMTETLVTHMCPVDSSRFGYSGQLLPNVQAKVLDTETGLPLPAYQNGEICMRTPCLMKGYHNNIAATKACVDEDGWMHSGDIGHYDEDGYFKIVDRTKELIKVNALQVSPSEIEDTILTLPEVVEVSVIGVPHDVTGEAPRAYVVTNANIPTKKVEDLVKTNMAKHKHLAGGVRFVTALPKNATGKVMRKELVKMAQEEK